MKRATVHFISAMNPSTVARQYHNRLRHRIESLQGYVGRVRKSALALWSLAIAFSQRPQVRAKALWIERVAAAAKRMPEFASTGLLAAYGAWSNRRVHNGLERLQLFVGRERTLARAALGGGDALAARIWSRAKVTWALSKVIPIWNSPSLIPFGCGAVIGGVIVFVVSAMPLPGQPVASTPRPGDKRTPTSDGYAYVVDQQAEVRAGAGRGTERLSPLVAISTVNSDRPVSTRQPRPMESAPSAPFRGSLAVTSRPSGARVSLNGRPAGKTPLVLRNLPVGSRAVRLELDRYQPWSSAIRVITNQQARVMVDLHPTGAP
jgi:hypothetical protein